MLETLVLDGAFKTLHPFAALVALVKDGRLPELKHLVLPALRFSRHTSTSRHMQGYRQRIDPLAAAGINVVDGKGVDSPLRLPASKFSLPSDVLSRILKLAKKLQKS